MIKIGTLMMQIKKEVFDKEYDNPDLKACLEGILDELSSWEDSSVEVTYEQITGHYLEIRGWEGNIPLKQQLFLQKEAVNRLKKTNDVLKKMGFKSKIYARTRKGNSEVPTWAEDPFISIDFTTGKISR
jgi:hypothetical protein